MQLRDYLHFNRITCEKLAKELGVCAQYIRSIKLNKKKPGPKLSEKIELLTGGEVTIEDLRGIDEKK